MGLLWIYDYIPLLFLLKVSITVFLLLFTWTISVTYYLLRFYFKHHLLLGFHLPLSPSQFLLNVGNMLGTPSLFSEWEQGTLSLFGQSRLSTSQCLVVMGHGGAAGALT